MIRHLDRSIVMAAAAGLFLLSWLHVAWMNASPVQARSGAWTGSDVLSAFLMWTLMMTGMMLPSVLPWVWALTHQGDDAAAPLVFLAGYLSIWAAFSLGAALAQAVLHDLALLSLPLQKLGAFPAGLMLLAAGSYHLTPARAACLEHCRSPLAFFLTSWKPGRPGALRMGLQHGLFCLGCCWALMLLSFAAGVMNLLWMAAVTLFVLFDHALLRAPWPGRAAGALLLAWGGWLLLGWVFGSHQPAL